MKMKTIPVKIACVLLDPNNPRFVFRDAQKKVEAVLADDDVQEMTLKRMMSSEFDVASLMGAIKTDGWLEVDRLFVRRYKKTDKFIVVEGNRRIAAIKKLLKKDTSGSAADKLKPNVKKSLQELDCVDLTGATKQEQDRILGLRHHGAIKNWALLPSSRNIFATYLEQIEASSHLEYFYAAKPHAESVAKIFSLKSADVRDKLNAYRLYLQILENIPEENQEALDEAFSIIQDSVKSPDMRKYLEFNREKGTLEEEELALFIDLIFDSDKHKALIKQASAGDANLRDFVYVLKHDPKEFARMVDERIKPSEAKADLLSKSAETGMLRCFQKIKAEIKKIKISEAEKGVPAEVQAIIESLESTIKAIRKHY